MAGYSGTPLAKKLGIKEGSRVALLGRPEGFEASLDLPPGAHYAPAAEREIDVLVFFTTSRDELATRWPELMEAVLPDGGLWIAWPKKASKVPTDITEDVLREIGLPTGMVDNKVCAIDDTWSGLRFVYRKELRKTSAGRR